MISYMTEDKEDKDCLHYIRGFKWIPRYELPGYDISDGIPGQD